MANFVEDATVLPTDFADGRQLDPDFEDPKKSHTAAQKNATNQACNDLKTKVSKLGGKGPVNSGKAVFTSGGASFVDIDFTQAPHSPYASGQEDYRVEWTLVVSSGAVPQVFFPSAQKTLTGLRIEVTSPFDGHILWTTKFGA